MRIDFVRELVAVLRMNAFAFLEVNIKLRGGDAHTLAAGALKMHLDA